MRALSVALLAAALVLAGCSSPTSEDDASNVLASGDPLEGRRMQTLANSLPAEVEQVHWANGTIAAQDACNPVGCALGEGTWQRVTDLTPALPAGVAVQVEVELRYTPHPAFGFAMQVVLQPGDSVVYGQSQTGEPGRSTVVATLLPRGTVEAVVMDFHPTLEGPSSSYSLRLRIVASPTLVMPGVPVGVTLTGGDTLRVGLVGEGREFLLFAPDGSRLGIFAENVTLDAAARTGEHAVLLPPGGAAALASDNGDASLRPLGLRRELGPATVVAQHGPTEESWDVAGVPVGVGLRIFSREVAASLSPFITTDLAATLSGPNGFVLDPGQLGGYITFGELGNELQWMSPLGDPRVTAGTYTLHAESTATHEAHVEGFAVFIDAAA